MWQKVLRISFLILGLIILYISIARSSLDLMIKDEKENELRKVPIRSEFTATDGAKVKIEYKLPETRTLPSSPFYVLKRIRDSLWVNFTKDPLDKCRVLILIADKKMEEARLMDKDSRGKQIIVRTTIEAINQLKLASEGLRTNQLDEAGKEKILFQINQAKYAYKEIIKSFEIEKEEKDYLESEIEKVF